MIELSLEKEPEVGLLSDLINKTLSEIPGPAGDNKCSSETSQILRGLVCIY